MSSEVSLKLVCRACKSTNILQQVTKMIDPNDQDITTIEISDMYMDDYFYCNECEDSCSVEEINELNE